MDKFSRILVSLLLAVILVAGIAAIFPHVAYAAGCSGTGCNGHDPVKYGCASGAYPILAKTM